VFHDSGNIRDEIIEKAETAFLHLSKENTNNIVTKFSQFQDAKGQFETPEFHLSCPNLKGDTKNHGKSRQAHSSSR
jgi:hypothetical protein